MLDEKTKNLIKEKTNEEAVKHHKIQKVLENAIKSKEKRREILDIILDYTNLLREEGSVQNKRYYEVEFSSGVKLILDCYKTL